MNNEGEFLVQIGTVTGGKTFIRVIHTASKRERSQVGTFGETYDAIQDRLKQEILDQLHATKNPKTK